jgi:hypothetical protein
MGGRKVLLGVGIALVLSLWGLQIAALAVPKWSRIFEDSEIESTFGLFECDDCPGYWEDGSVYCYEDLFCDNPSSGACKNFRDLVYGGELYLACTVVSFVFGLMVLERLVYSMGGVGANHPASFYTAAFGQHIFQVVATAIWFAYTEAEFDADCDTDNGGDSEDRFDICAYDGPVLAVVCIIWSFFVFLGVSFIFKFGHELKALVSGEFHKKVLFNSAIWQWLSLVHQLLAAALIIGGMTTPRYYKLSDRFGGLTFYERIQYSDEDIPTTYGPAHECVASFYCNVESSTNAVQDFYDGICDTFEDLRIAGEAALVLDIVALIFLAIWAEHTATVGAKVPFGWKWCDVSHGAFVWILHLVSIIVWHAITEAEYDQDCDEFETDDSKSEICPEIGANMHVAAIILLGVAWFASIIAKLGLKHTVVATSQ